MGEINKKVIFNSMENKKSFDIKSFDFTAANLPTFEEVVSNKDWVLWGGDNMWCNHSIALYNYSPTLRSALNSVLDAVIGRGMLINGVDGNKVLANGTESYYDIFKKAATDFVIHNGFTLNTVLRRDREGIAEVYHTDISKIRVGKSDEFDRIKEFWFSNDWMNARGKYKPTELPAFDLNTEEGSQIWFYKTYQPSQFYYPVNSWIGCRVAAECQTEVFNYHINNLRNGYHSGTIFSMNNGVPSAEERTNIYRHLEDKFTSTNNAGNLIVTFSDDKDHEPTVIPIANNASPEMFSTLNETLQQAILTSVRISNPSLLGIKTVQGLGSKDEMRDAYDHFLSTLIIPVQEQLLREFEKLRFYQTKEMVTITLIQNKLFADKAEEKEITV